MIELNIAPFLSIKDIKNKGRGVFTSKDIAAGEIVEVSPVLPLTEKERKEVEKTILYDYIFEWGHDTNDACVAWGYVSLYNHSYDSNCEYEMDFSLNIISIRTVKDIKKGEELTLNYNGDYDLKDPVWFDVK